MLSIYEIAKGANVSPATVSRALNPELRHKVKQKTLEKILDFCEANNYYGKLAARSLASGKTFCIGLVLGAIENDFASPFFAQQISGILDTLSVHGYTLKVIPVPHGKPKEIDKGVRKALLSNEVDGFILNAAMIGGETLSELKKMDFPVVILTAAHVEVQLTEIPTFGINNQIGFREFCGYLVKKGHRRIAMLGAEEDMRTALLKKEAEKAGIETAEFLFHDLSPSIVRQTMQMYLKVKDNWDSLKKYPAWFCVTDLWALGARKAKEELAKGSDIFLCGYDNIEENVNYFNTEKPFLSTIAPPYRELGKAATEFLFQYDFQRKLTLLDSRFILRNQATEKNK